MKLLLKLSLAALVAVVILGLGSCSKDTDPADVDLFIGVKFHKVVYDNLY